jgi:hypothetical protein
MLVKVFTIITIATSVSLFGASNAVADHGNLSGEQVKQLLAGAKANGKTGRGDKFETQYAANGNVTIEVSNGFSDSGKWSVEGDHYCAQTQKLRDGKKACWTLRHLNGDNYLFKGVNGARSIKGTITK